MTETDTAHKREHLLEAINEASSNVRNAYLTFLLAGLYFAILIGSTTDEQLLRESGVTLPLLSIDLPIIGFYVVAPPLFLLLHLNMLLMFSLLADKLSPLRDSLADLPPLERNHWMFRVATFPFTQLWLRDTKVGGTHFFLQLFVWLSIAILPPVVLQWALLRFLCYQDDAITFLHQMLLIADIVLLVGFWSKVVPNGSITQARPVLSYSLKGIAGVVVVVTFFASVPRGGFRTAFRRLAGCR